MKQLLLSLVLVLALPILCRAETVATDYYTVDLPDGWTLLQDDNDNSIAITVFTTKTKDTIVTIVVGANGGADVATITKCFSMQYKTTKEPSVRKGVGTFGYKNYEGLDGTAYVTLQDQLYMVITAAGNQRKAKALIQAIKSEGYADLIPAL